MNDFKTFICDLSLKSFLSFLTKFYFQTLKPLI